MEETSIILRGERSQSVSSAICHSGKDKTMKTVKNKKISLVAMGRDGGETMNR